MVGEINLCLTSCADELGFWTHMLKWDLFSLEMPISVQLTGGGA